MDLLPLLFVLGICSSLAIGNVKTAPEDLDGSGDDEEDFSGSGFSVEDDSEDGDVLSTPAAPLVTTVTQLSTAPKLNIAIEEKTEENATQYTPTTKSHDPVEDIFAFHPVGKEPFVEEGTTLEPTSHQTSVEPVNDVKKHHHHHHHHHHHPHHHTTMPVTSSPAKFDVIEETTASPAVIEGTTASPAVIEETTASPAVIETTASPAEVEKPFVTPEETTTITPDEGDVDDLVEVITTPEGSDVEHVDHPETTSGLTSTSSTHEETTVDLADIAEIPVFVDSEEKTTVADDANKHHHHHHHHHHTTTSSTAVPLDGFDDLAETEMPDYPGPEDQDHEGEATTTPPSEDKHHDHKHHHHHHHTTTPEATQSTVSELPTVHTQDPKGRRINVPPAETTTEISVMSGEEEPVASTVQYVHPVSPTQDDDSSDSSEDESGDGSVEGDDIFFEATVPLDKSDRMAPAPDDGSSGASHGIMERKELLAGIIAGGIAGLVFAASLVAFVLYRMKKKDEGSYSLEEPKQSNGGYQKPREQREFYA